MMKRAQSGISSTIITALLRNDTLTNNQIKALMPKEQDPALEEKNEEELQMEYFELPSYFNFTPLQRNNLSEL